MTPPELPAVPVGPFRVADASSDEITAVSIAKWQEAVGPVLAFDFHVGALLHQDDEAFLAAMAQADLVYADGTAIVFLARRAGKRAASSAAPRPITGTCSSPPWPR